MRNAFTNPNVMSWYKWIFLRKDSLPGVTLYFLSRRNSTSPRFFPLYDNTSLVRIVLLHGSRLPYLDFLYLRFLRLFLRLFSRSFSQYKYFFVLDIPSSQWVTTNQILHIDDPLYTDEEIRQLKSWEFKLQQNEFDSKIVVTTDFMKNYFKECNVKSEIEVISQGFSSIIIANNSPSFEDNSSFKLVYISPYIDSFGDPHAGHPMWDASVLIDDIWPQISHLKRIELHLIGRVGNEAKKKLLQPNVIQHGFLSISEVAKTLARYDLALYPRVHDNRWQPQKIIEYMGAGVPIVAFDLVDTRLIRELRIGCLVANTDKFVSEIKNLMENQKLLQEFRENCLQKRNEFSWEYLGKKLDGVIKYSRYS